MDFNLEQPRLKFTGYGTIIDHVGGKFSAFGEAASIPYVSPNTIFDQKGEQKLRLRVLNFTMSRRVWKGSHVSFLSLEDAAIDEDKHGDQDYYKIDRNDMLNAEIQVNCYIFYIKRSSLIQTPQLVQLFGGVIELIDGSSKGRIAKNALFLYVFNENFP